MATKERIETTRYYDVVNFARKINVPAYFTLSRPEKAHTQRSVTIPSRKQMRHLRRVLFCMMPIEHSQQCC